MREAHDHLTEDQWLVCGLKGAGYTASEIAETRGGTPDAVNMVFSRAKRKLRALLESLPTGSADRGARGASPRAVPETPTRKSGHEQADGELAPASRLVCVHRRE